MAKKDSKKKRGDQDDKDGFNIEINEFGEIVTSMNIDEINTFLNKNLEDKKLKGQQGIEEEE